MAASPQDNPKPTKPKKLLGPYFQIRAALQEAIRAMLESPKNPDVPAVQSAFERYLVCYDQADPGLILDQFLVLVDQQLKQKACFVDPLVIYTLRFTLASSLHIKS